jgi:hypothetical protein
MDLLSVTTTEAVRALIGIDEASQELPDALFTAFEIEDALQLELGTWLPVPLATVLAGNDGSGDSADLAYLALRNASKAWCAWQVLQAGEISIAQKHEDGQNAVTRQSFKLEQLLQRLGGLYSKYRDMCLAYLGQTTTSSTAWLAGISSPAYDPVTNV